MGFRQKFLGYSGGLFVVFGLMMTIIGNWLQTLQINSTASRIINAGIGVPMWTGLVIIMCGLANIVTAFEKKKKRPRGGPEFPWSFSTLLANLVALVMSAVCIGILSWAAYPYYFRDSSLITPNSADEGVLGVYSTVVIAASFIFIFAFMSLFIDCCVGSFFGFGVPMAPYGQREGPYDMYGRSPAAIYKA